MAYWRFIFGRTNVAIFHYDRFARAVRSFQHAPSYFFSALQSPYVIECAQVKWFHFGFPHSKVKIKRNCGVSTNFHTPADIRDKSQRVNVPVSSIYLE